MSHDDDTPDNGQLDLFAGVEDDEHGPVLTTTEKFVAFHAANPLVYEVLVRLAREWVAKTGRKKIGIATLYERCRWEIAISTSDADYKVNNDHRAFYARLIMAQEKDLADLFDLRRSEADEWARGLGGAA